MSYSRTRPGERGRVTGVYAREAVRTYNGYHAAGDMAPVSSGARMVSRRGGAATFAPSTRVVSGKSTDTAGATGVPTRPGYTWVPAAGGIAGHWVRKAAAGPRAAPRGAGAAPDYKQYPERWCRFYGFTTAGDLLACMKAKARPDADEWTPELIREVIDRGRKEREAAAVVRDQRGQVDPRAGDRVAYPTGPIGTPGPNGAVLPGATLPPKDPTLPPWQGPGVGPGAGPGGGAAWDGGAMEPWGGGAALPGEMAPIVRPPFRPRTAVPWGLVAAGGLGVVALYYVLKRKK